MKWNIFLPLIFIGFVAGDGAWKENREYKYKLVAKTFLTVPGSDRQNGAISHATFTIRPLSNDTLIGKITQAGSGEIDRQISGEQNSNFSVKQSSSGDVPLNQLFKIHLKNGAIHSLSVDRTMTISQINIIKFIVSQLQVDTKAENVMESADNNLPNENTNNAFYKTMEPTVSGACETTYDISLVPEYLRHSKFDLILPELVGEGEVIQILKNKNYKNCIERTRYLFDLAGHKKEADRIDTDLDISLTSQIYVTGSLNDYTIQSTATTNKVGDLGEYIYVTLESMEPINTNYDTGLENLVNVASLVYTYDSPKKDSELSDSANHIRSTKSDGPQSVVAEAWSGCWTAFPSAATICKDEFSAEWENVRHVCCGLFCFGKKAKCRHSFPGCEATTCYSAFVSRSSLCSRSFGDKLSVTKGGFEDCAPGFWQSRCCPISYLH